MSTLVINLILEPGKPGCQVAVTSEHDQVIQQFGDPQAALEAALLAGAAIRLADEQMEHLREIDRQQMTRQGLAQADRIVERRPTGDSYLDEACFTAPQLDGHFHEERSEVLPEEAAAGVSVVPSQNPDGVTPSLRSFTDEPGEAFLAPEPPGSQPNAREHLVQAAFLFESAKHQAASALCLWDEGPQDIVARLQRVEALLFGALSSFDKGLCALPFGEGAKAQEVLLKMRHLGGELLRKSAELVRAGDVKHIEPAWKLVCSIQRILASEAFSPVAQKETAPACAEASPPAGLPA